LPARVHPPNIISTGQREGALPARVHPPKKQFCIFLDRLFSK
jgi:hypothetical protein